MGEDAFSGLSEGGCIGVPLARYMFEEVVGIFLILFQDIAENSFIVEITAKAACEIGKLHDGHESSRISLHVSTVFEYSYLFR